MLVACWSAKGGAGTTVVACSLSLLLARSSPAVLVDLAGDVPATLGLADPPFGVGDWLAADPPAGADALDRLAVAAGGASTLSVVGEGSCPPAGDATSLVDALRADERAVVVDCGVVRSGEEPGALVARLADLSLLVTRSCYVALRRALAAPVRPHAAVLVAEPERALGRRDVEEVLGVDIRVELAVDPSIARAADAGMLHARLPRGLERALEPVA